MSPTRLSEQDGSKTVELHPGDELEVLLKSNPTAGYRWEVASVDVAILKLVGEPEFTPFSGALGAGGKVSVRFKALSTGQTALQLIYRRSFEKHTPPTRTFKTTVIVK
jgi:inhibitor of cysteine peptidase